MVVNHSDYFADGQPADWRRPAWRDVLTRAIRSNYQEAT